jgi:hypothetical protein
MPRRNELNSICHNLLHTFLSRNNDLNGYWAIGLLYLNATRAGELTLRIDLADEPSVTTAVMQSPIDIVMTKLAERYRERLVAMLDERNLPRAWVTQAYITITFECKHANLTTAPVGPAQAYCAKLTIIGDDGHMHERSLAGYVWKHGSFREGRSNRASDLPLSIF